MKSLAPTPGLFYFLAICLCIPGIANAQAIPISNAGFESGLDGWVPFVAPQVEISTSTEAIEGATSCLVANRQQFWTGLKRDMLPHLQRDKDYRFTFQAKSVPVTDSVLKISLRQTDARGTVYIEIGNLLINANEWSFFEAGFHLQVNGALEELDLIIAGAEGNIDDFLVDDLTLELREWRAEADARIEAIRKTDLQLSVVDDSGQAMGGAEVSAQQLRSHFAFGSTLSCQVTSDQQYADFFSEHFEWATTEWRLQWKPVEEVRDVEVYELGDSSVAYCEENDIQVRGHSIIWPQPAFVPSWLPPLDDEEIMQEVDERIQNAVHRYRGRLASWDVCNEMLDNRFYRDRLGEDINAHVFRETRKIDPDVELCLNETGFLDRHNNFRSTQMEFLFNDLQSRGAEINCLGLQSHFFQPNVSPVNMDLALTRLGQLGLPIWVTEYDTVNPDPVERAKQLETFYRYAFSRPEIDGIIMWGFWAGAHWRGEDAALVDLDWTVNAAGQQYFDLIDEWTTSEQGATDADGGFQMRGFQGTYLVEARNPDTDALSSHIVCLPPSADGLQQTELRLPEAAGVLSVYGSADADEFTIDLDNLTNIRIGDQLVPLPEDLNRTAIRLEGLGQDDTLTILGQKDSAAAATYLMRTGVLTVSGFPIKIEYAGIENVKVKSRNTDDQIFLFDSHDDDQFMSTPKLSSMTGSGVQLVAEAFRTVTGRAGAGNDSATLVDSPAIDFGFSNLSYMRIQDELTVRRAVGFEANTMTSSEANDWVNIGCPIGEKLIDVSAGSAELSMNGATYQFDSFPLTRLIGTNGNEDVVNISDSFFGDEYIFLRENFFRYDMSDFRMIATQFSNANVVGSYSGADVLRVRDGNGDDLFQAGEDSCLMVGDSFQYSASGFDVVEVVGNQGGENTAQIEEANFELLLLGVWNFID